MFTHKVFVELCQVVSHLRCDFESYLECSDIVLAHAHAVDYGHVHGFFILFVGLCPVEKTLKGYLGHKGWIPFAP